MIEERIWQALSYESPARQFRDAVEAVLPVIDMPDRGGVTGPCRDGFNRPGRPGL